MARLKTMDAEHYAHSLPGRPVQEWQKLIDHLRQTGNLAETFAKYFAPGWGRLAGLWHDVGKYQRAFQRRIGVDPEAHVNEKVDHSTAGALLARDRRAGTIPFVIAGHHGGLPNAEDLRARLVNKAQLIADARSDGLPSWIENEPVPPQPDWVNDYATLSMWTRFVFSALVDADFLDTERFYAGGVERDLGKQPSIQELGRRLDRYMVRKGSAAKATPVNAMRQRVLTACKAAAKSSPGLFTMTVPTGGGKTLSSLAFAIDHALNHGLRRVIVVIPYTSIVEQTALVFREAIGEDAVVEHHINVDPDEETSANRLASENWDAPVVVTTSVQFFESLYANRPSRCRKLHRIARSVVVLDEVQTFPTKLLAPVTNALRELTSHFGTTAVLCTATQPVLLEDAREIVPEPDAEFSVVGKRCNYIMPPTSEPVTWEALSDELQMHSQVMVIVHRRQDAQQLAQIIGEDCLHLSARMCASHRAAVLAEVRSRLQAGEACRLVATQLVEAGVDLDFPVVYRAFAGADSLAQAAGRCNREGKGEGRFHVFLAPTEPPQGILRTAERLTRAMWEEGRLDLRRPATFEEFFRRLYQVSEQDSPAVMTAERKQRFADVARQFRMIEDIGHPVVAPYGQWAERVEEIRREGVTRLSMRRLQPYLVSLYGEEIETLAEAGVVTKVGKMFWEVVPGFRVYNERWGFGWQGRPQAEPEDFIA